MIGAKLFGYWDEVRRAAKLSADLRSFLRLSLDLLLYRRPFIDLVPRGRQNRPRTIKVRGGVTLQYRLNVGDIWSLREVWLCECYRFPLDIQPANIVDLGANIGLAAVWLARRYAARIIAVEPVAANQEIARRNLSQNNLNAIVVRAAIGCRDGSVGFIAREKSNVGQIDYGAQSGSVPLVSMNSLLEKYAAGQRIGLLKLDIEGGEHELFSANLEWLQNVDAIIAEFHPRRESGDYAALITRLQEEGFRYIPANSVFPDNMDSFIRESAR